MILVHFQSKPFNIIVIQLYAPTTNAEDAEINQFYEELEDHLEVTPKKDVLFITGDGNAKVGSQDIPGITGKFGLGEQNEAGERLTEFCQVNALIIANPLFHNTRDDFTHGHQQTVNILCSLRWRTCIQLAKTRPGADCGSDHQLHIANFRLKLKKTRKNTRLAMYG